MTDSIETTAADSAPVNLPEAFAATFAVADLRAAVTRAAKIIDRRSSVPVLSCLVIDSRGGGCTVYANNLDLALSIPVRADVETPGRLCVNAAALLDLLKGLDAKGGGVEIVADDGAAVASLVCGRGRYQLAVRAAGDYPILTGVDADKSVALDLDARQFADDLARASFAVSTEETRYYLNGVCMIPEGPAVLALVATDGHRLARVRRPMPATERRDNFHIDDSGLIVPRFAVAAIVAAVGKAKAGAASRFHTDGKRFAFTHDGATVAGKLIDGNFPAYQRVIPTANDNLLEVHAPTLAAAVKQASAVCTSRTRAVRVNLDSASRAVLTCTNEDGATACAEVPVEFAGLETEMGFNAGYMRECLAQFGDGVVSIEIADAAAPVRMTGTDTPELDIVLMPMRVGLSADSATRRRVGAAVGDDAASAAVIADLPDSVVEAVAVADGAAVDSPEYAAAVETVAAWQGESDAEAARLIADATAAAFNVAAAFGITPAMMSPVAVDPVDLDADAAPADDAPFVVPDALRRSHIAPDADSGDFSADSDDMGDNALEGGFGAEAPALPASGGNAADLAPVQSFAAFVSERLGTRQWFVGRNSAKRREAGKVGISAAEYAALESEYRAMTAPAAVDLADTVAALLARVAALESALAANAKPDPVAVAVAADNAIAAAVDSARLEQAEAQLIDGKAERDALAAEVEKLRAALVDAQADRDDWQAIAEQNSARLDSERAAVKADLAAMAGYEKRADSLYRKRQRTAALLLRERSRRVASDATFHGLAIRNTMLVQERERLAAENAALRADLARARTLAPLAGIKWAPTRFDRDRLAA